MGSQCPQLERRMKTLQNNFTTPEESKKLLELGVPVLTADCYFYVQEINGRNVCDTPNLVPYGMGEFGLRHWWTNRNNARYIPCWSAGRLIVIYETCSGKKFERADDGSSIMQDAFETIFYLYQELDFSKLND